MTPSNLRSPSRLALLLIVLVAAAVVGSACAGSSSDHGHDDDHGHGEEHGDHQDEADHHEDGDHHDEADHHQDGDHHHDEGESWAVTVWGDHFEIFPETDALVAGEAAGSHVHVTILDGFAPLTEGRVDIILTRSGDEQVFSASEPIRPGIYQIDVAPTETGDYDLSFRVAAASGEEMISGGRVRVGTDDDPGGLIEDSGHAEHVPASEPESFLKEPQWNTEFATEWVREGSFARSLEGLAVARPAAGGEAWITAPVEALVQPTPWPYVGQPFDAGETIFRLAPSVPAARSLAELQADVDAAQQELAAADSRLARLEKLLEVEATSVREVEDARTRAGVAKARHDASRADLEAARAARQGRVSSAALRITAPFPGRMAAIEATPGASAAAADRLARLVRTDVVWLSVALPPSAASEVSAGISGIVLGDAHRVSGDEARLVSVAPGVDPDTGKLDVLVEIPGETVPLGSTWNAQILLASDEQGIVIPTSALVDDGGESVVYLQLGGESFVRQPVDVTARQGDRALVEGLLPGQRLVTQGGDSIRRSSLMASGAGHGHVH